MTARSTAAAQAAQASAESSATAAGNAATQAEASKVAAQAAQSAAESFTVSASGYATAAETAQGKAEDAQAAAEAAAQQAAEELSDLEAALDTKAGILRDTASGSIASFVPDSTIPNLLSLSVAVEPVQAGSGDPSPDNVRPISGWDAVKVTRTGKNLLPNEAVSGSAAGITWIKNADGSITINGTANRNYTIPIYGSSFNDLKPFPYSDKPITLSGCPSGGGTSSFRLGGYLYKDGVYANKTLIDTGGTTTVSGADFNQIYFLIFVYSGYTFNNVTFYPMVEYGSVSTASAYEPYQGDTYTIQLGQTVYGGTLDVTGGKMVVDRAMVDMGSLEYLYNPSVPDHPFFASAISDMAGGTDKYLCSNYANSGQHETIAQVPDMACMTIGQQFRVRDSRYDNAADFKAAVSGVQRVYALATPIEIPLTPTQISALQGNNTVWSDAGDVTVDFAADLKTYIDNKIAAAVAALS